MQLFLDSHDFRRAGHIVVDEEGVIVFCLEEPYRRNGVNATRRGWVYAWIAEAMQDGNPFQQVLYVGKAGGSLLARCKQHEGGFAGGSLTGLRHAERIFTYLAEHPTHRIGVFARKSAELTILGMPSVSACEIEERAVIMRCLREGQAVWNTALPAAVPPPVPVAAALEPAADDDPALAEAVFMASLDDAAAVDAITAVQNAFADVPNVELYCTFTNGADLRLRCHNRHGGQAVVARLWWQPRVRAVAVESSASVASCQALGAASVEPPYDHHPANIQSRARVDVSDGAAALTAILTAAVNEYLDAA